MIEAESKRENVLKKKKREKSWQRAINIQSPTEE